MYKRQSQHWQECVCGYKTGETAHELTSKYDTAEHWQECELSLIHI